MVHVPQHRSPVLVGRTDELADLRAVAARADAGQPGTALVLGEAGVGKSRLTTELVGELESQGALVLVSHGVELLGGELPYGGLAEAVRGLVRTLGADEVRRILGEDLAGLAAFHSALGPASRPTREEVTSALLALVDGLAEDRLVCWVLDDLQWLDVATRDLVHYLVRVARDARLLVMATVRTTAAAPDELPDELLELSRSPGLVTLTLRPLGAADVAAQVALLVGDDLPRDDVARICRLSDGLPFFVEQLVAARGETPGTVRKLLLTNVRDLSDEGRMLLRAAAVAEGLLRPELLAAVTGLDGPTFAAALAETRACGVLRVDRDGDTLRFRHALLREAVDGELLASDRRALHRAWADVLDRAGGDGAELVVERALHRYSSGDPAAAFLPVLAAAQLTLPSEDHAARARWWERVVELWPRDVAEAEGLTRDRALSHALAAYPLVGRLEDLVPVLQREQSEADDWLRSLWLHLVLRQAELVLGRADDWGVADDDVDDQLDRLRRIDGDFRVRWVLHLLLHAWELDRPDLYRPIGEELLRRSEADGDFATWQLASRHLGWWQARHGDLDGQVDRARRAVLVVTERAPEMRMEADNDLIWALVEAARYSEAVDAARLALARVRDPRAMLMSWAEVNAGLVSALDHLGEWDEAIERAETALAQPLSGVMIIRSLEGSRRRLLVHRGAEPLSVTALSRAAEVSRVRDFARLPYLAADLDVALLGQDWSTAAELLADAVQVRSPDSDLDDSWEILLAAARAVGESADPVLVQRLEAARRWLGDLLDVLPERIGAPIRGEVAEHVARLTGTDAPATWARLADGWSVLGRPYDVAWCRLREAEACLRAGDRAVAAAAAAGAHGIAAGLGSGPMRARIEALARRGRLDLPGLRVGGLAAAGRLTDREGEVLRLLSRGRTNDQIAGELFISPKTASVHVSRILAKLGVANRTEAASYAHRHGLD